MERLIINRVDLINKLNAMKYENISELQMTMMFKTMGSKIQVEEAKDDVDCNMN